MQFYNRVFSAVLYVVCVHFAGTLVASCAFYPQMVSRQQQPKCPINRQTRANWAGLHQVFTKNHSFCVFLEIALLLLQIFGMIMQLIKVSFLLTMIIIIVTTSAFFNNNNSPG